MSLYYCTTKVWKLQPDALLNKSKRQNGHSHCCVLTYVALLSTLLHLFHLLILVFHLKQKHEEGQRLLHYLQQTNTALATGTFIYIFNQQACGKEIIISTILSFHWWNQIFKFVTGLGTLCNSLIYGCTSYYYFSSLFSLKWIAKD